MDNEGAANSVPFSLYQTPKGTIVVQFGPLVSIMSCTQSQIFLDYVQKFKPVEKCEGCAANEKLVESGTALVEIPAPTTNGKPTIH